jgi:hypothetical protein
MPTPAFDLFPKAQCWGSPPDTISIGDREMMQGDQAMERRMTVASDPPEGDRECCVEVLLRSRPSWSQAVIEESEAGLRLILPPVDRFTDGAWPGGLIVSGLVVAMDVVMAWAQLNGWIYGPLMAGFWFFAVFMTLGAFFCTVWEWNSWRQRTTVEVSEHRLRIHKQGPYFTFEREWSRRQLTGVAVGKSSLRGAWRQVPLLEVRSRDGPSTHLQGRDRAELQWIAELLKAKLRL